MATPTLDPTAIQFDLQLNLADRVMSFRGALDASAAPLLLASITSMLNHEPGRLSIDLHDVTFLHESAIAVLTEVRDVQHDRGYQFHLINAPALLMRILLAAGLGALLPTPRLADILAPARAQANAAASGRSSAPRSARPRLLVDGVPHLTSESVGRPGRTPRPPGTGRTVHSVQGSGV